MNYFIRVISYSYLDEKVDKAKYKFLAFFAFSELSKLGIRGEIPVSINYKIINI